MTMKFKHFALFCLILVLSTTAFAVKVPIEMARLVAKNTYFQQANRHASVPFSTISITGEFTEQYNNHDVYYAFNINDKGFVIISADDICYPVIGFSFESSYSNSDAGSSFAYWMDLRKKEIAYNVENSIPAEPMNTSTWKLLCSSDPSQLLKGIEKSNLDVSPLITTLWDQGFPYNERVPADATCSSFGGHVTTGCIATAMAQIMYYWRWPSMGTGYHCDGYHNYGFLCAHFDTVYDWNGMVDQPSKENIPVAVLMSHCGISVDMHYNADGACSSAATTSSVVTALKNYFKYSQNCQYVQKSSYSTTGWNNLLQGDLNAGEPIEYAGNDGTEGHAWVCDGYMATDYYHMNWGWSGSSNGYFYLTNLNPGGYVFNNGQEAAVHITPDPSLYPVFCSGNTIVSGDDYGTIEDGSGPVADYQNNSNCSWLIAPDDSVSSISLTFEKFKTDPADILTVYDGPTTASPVLGTFSGPTLPTQTVTSTGPQMFITFVSNSNTTAPGFLLNYTAKVVPFCNSITTMTDATGTFGDYSGRFQYRNNTNCKWNIYPTNAVSITINFNNFNTESVNDKVLVYNIGASQPALLGEYSGDHTSDPIPSVTVPSGKAMVMWITNGTIRGAGWDATYDIIAGTNDHKAFEDLTVSPNPTSGAINIRFTVQEIQQVKVEVQSMTGITVYSEVVNNLSGTFDKQVDLSNLAKGIYILRLVSDAGIRTEKIIVK
jgi:hypothetical protein